MGCIMGPATGSVMGAVPKEKSGVASAMNDVTRQVGGSLGTAVIGSLVTTFYGSRVADATAGLPDGAASAVKDSIGGANAVADKLPADQCATPTLPRPSRWPCRRPETPHEHHLRRRPVRPRRRADLYGRAARRVLEGGLRRRARRMERADRRAAAAVRRGRGLPRSRRRQGS